MELEDFKAEMRLKVDSSRSFQLQFVNVYNYLSIKKYSCNRQTINQCVIWL